MIFITNNFDLPAATIAKRYKMRWKIELFFKWIKQNLRIKTFFGNNENAVKTQVWVAVCTYLIVAIIKKEQKILQPMSEILQVLAILQFEKRPISELFARPRKCRNDLKKALSQVMELIDNAEVMSNRGDRT